MNKILALILVFGLVACKPDVIVRREIVKVPVIIFKEPPKAANVVKIDLPIFALTSESSNQEISKAYVDTIAILQFLTAQQEAAIKPFTKSEETIDD